MTVVTARGAASLLSQVALPVLLAALGFALAVAPWTTLIAAALLIPGLVAWLLDGDPGRPTGRTMLGFGVAAGYAPIVTVIQLGSSAPLGRSLAAGAEAISWAWAAAGAGWVLCQLLGLAFSYYARRQAAAEVADLRRERQEIEAEWDVVDARLE